MTIQSYDVTGSCGHVIIIHELSQIFPLRYNMPEIDCQLEI